MENQSPVKKFGNVHSPAEMKVLQVDLTFISNNLTVYIKGSAELQIRGDIEDNSKIIFLTVYLNENICCNPSLELSR